MMCKKMCFLFLESGFTLGDFSGIVTDEFFPTLGAFLARIGTAHLQIMAVGGSQSIGCIQELGHIGLVQMQYSLQHAGNLLFAGGTGTCYSHLDFHGGVLGDGHAVVDGGGYGYALGPAQF